MMDAPASGGCWLETTMEVEQPQFLENPCETHESSHIHWTTCAFQVGLNICDHMMDCNNFHQTIVKIMV